MAKQSCTGVQTYIVLGTGVCLSSLKQQGRGVDVPIEQSIHEWGSTQNNSLHRSIQTEYNRSAANVVKFSFSTVVS
jgi:hypothetical protein